MRLLLQGCKKGDRESQRLLYSHYYRYAMSIAMRYCHSIDEAKEVVNDGFMKVFTKLEMFQTDTSFKAWLRRIMINTAIDSYRRELKHAHHQDVDGAIVSIDNSAISNISHDELIAMVQRLTPAYRAVFSLHVIDGYKHEEIAKELGISVGTSKSNLMKARLKLKKMLEEATQEQKIYKHV